MPQPQLYDPAPAAYGAYAETAAAQAAGGAQRVAEPQQVLAGLGVGPAGPSLSRQSSASASDDLRLDQLPHGFPMPSLAHAPAHSHAMPPPAPQAPPPLGSHASAALAAAALPPAPAATGRAAVARAVAGVMSAAKDWRERVARLEGLSEALLAQGEAGLGAAETAEVERVLPKLMVALDDGHFKVGP